MVNFKHSIPKTGLKINLTKFPRGPVRAETFLGP